MLCLKKPRHHFPGNTSPAFRSVPPFLFSIANSEQARDNAKALAIPHHLPDAQNTQANGGINATQKRKLTKGSDTKPPPFSFVPAYEDAGCLSHTFLQVQHRVKAHFNYAEPHSRDFPSRKELLKTSCSIAGSRLTKNHIFVRKVNDQWHLTWRME